VVNRLYQDAVHLRRYVNTRAVRDCMALTRIGKYRRAEKARRSFSFLIIQISPLSKVWRDIFDITS
jgi:hypothetical protein